MNDKTAAIFLRLSGLVILSIVALYPLLPWLLGWRHDLNPVNTHTRTVFWVHNGFMVMLLLLQAILLLKWPKLLLTPSLASLALLIGLTCTWAYKLCSQFAYFTPTLRPTLEDLILFHGPLIPVTLMTILFITLTHRQCKALRLHA